MTNRDRRAGWRVLKTAELKTSQVLTTTAFNQVVAALCLRILTIPGEFVFTATKPKYQSVSPDIHCSQLRKTKKKNQHGQQLLSDLKKLLSAVETSTAKNDSLWEGHQSTFFRFWLSGLCALLLLPSILFERIKFYKKEKQKKTKNNKTKTQRNEKCRMTRVEAG